METRTRAGSVTLLNPQPPGQVKLTRQELRMARQLIESMTARWWWSET